MQKIKVWRVDSICGAEGDHRSLVARFATEIEAERAKSCAGGYGGEVSCETICIFESAIEFNPRLNKEAAARGISKLTLEEQAALGL